MKRNILYNFIHPDGIDDLDLSKISTPRGSFMPSIEGENGE
jgi:hypothetical protein